MNVAKERNIDECVIDVKKRTFHSISTASIVKELNKPTYYCTIIKEITPAIPLGF